MFRRKRNWDKDDTLDLRELNQLWERREEDIQGRHWTLDHDDPPHSGGRGRRILAVCGIIAALILSLVLFYQFARSHRGVRYLYNHDHYKMVTLLDKQGALDSDDGVYVALSYDALGKTDKAYAIYEDLFKPLRPFEDDVYVLAYKHYLQIALEKGDLSRADIKNLDFAVTGYEDELEIFKKDLLGSTEKAEDKGDKQIGHSRDTIDDSSKDAADAAAWDAAAAADEAEDAAAAGHYEEADEAASAAEEAAENSESGEAHEAAEAAMDAADSM